MLAHSQINRPINCTRGQTLFSCYVSKGTYKDIKSIQLVKIPLSPHSFGCCFPSPHFQFNIGDTSAWTYHCNLKLTMRSHTPFPAVTDHL